MIKTCSVKDLPNMRGKKVIVSRFYPRFLPKGVAEFVPELGPEKELLFGYKEGDIDEEEYRERYVNYLLTNMGTTKKLIELYPYVNSDNVLWLACFEKEGDFCHRHILKEVLENLDKYFPFKDIRCPRLYINDAKRRCSLKKTKVRLRLARDRKYLEFEKKLGHFELCDFHGLLRGNSLSECLLLTLTDGYFTCYTCIYNYKNVYCIRHMKRIDEVKKLSGKLHCVRYCENYLRLGECREFFELLKEGHRISDIKTALTEIFESRRELVVKG